MARRWTAAIFGMFLVGVVLGQLFLGEVRAVGQTCEKSTTCVIGEFLYDDSYAPINSDASCVLNSKNPDGSAFLNNQALSIGSSDGWYSYSFDTTSKTVGLYPSKICCTIGVGTTEYMCLDKTFQIQTAGVSSSEVATAVWNSGDRSLTDFGSLSTDVSSIKTTVSSIETKVSSLDTKIDTLTTNVGTLLSKWSTYSAADILNKVIGVGSSLGNQSDTCSTNTVFGNIACVKDKWGSQTAEGLYTAANGALNNINSLRSEISYSGKSTTVYEDLGNVQNYLETINTSIGSSGDTSSTSTLFGKIKSNKDDIAAVKTTVDSIETKINSLDTKINTITTNIGSLLTKWGSYSASDILNLMTSVNVNIGSTADTCSTNTVFGNIACVKDKWGDKTAQNLYDAANSSIGIGTSIISELNYNGKSTTVYQDIETLKTYVDTINTAVGTSADLSSDPTLFGKIKSNKEDIASVPTGVWGYANRTLTNFGTLVADIWGYTTRSLTGFGNLVADIWGNSTRTLTGAALNSGSLATIENVGSSLSVAVSSIKGSDNKDLSQVSIGISNVQNTTNSIISQISNLSTNIGTMGTKVDTLVTKWGSYSALDILANISGLNANIGSTADTCSTNTVFGNIACVKDKWGSQTAEGLYTAANGALNNINSLRSEISYSGKSTTAYEDLQNLKTYIQTINTNVGSSNDLASATTLFGKIKSNKEDIDSVATNVTSVKNTVENIESQVTVLDTKMTAIGATTGVLLSKWGSYSILDIYNKILTVNSSIGVSDDSCSVNTVFGKIACVKDKWGDKTAQNLYDAANGALNVGTSLISELGYNGKSTTAYSDMQTISGYITSLQNLVGNSGDLASATTLFGKIKSNKEDIANVGTQVSGVSGQVAGVQSSIDSVLTKITNLGVQVSNVNNDMDSLMDEWRNTSIADVLTAINGISGTLGAANDTCATSSIFGYIACVKDKWGDKTADSLYTATTNAINGITGMRSELNFNGKSTTAYEDLQTVKGYLNQLQTNMGSSTDTATATTVFGKIKKTQDMVNVLSGGQIEVDNTIDKWGTLSAADIYDKVKDLSSQISAVNTVSNVDSILSLNKTNTSDIDAMKNQLLSLRALIEVNQVLLEKSVNQPIIKTWLEEGSIIFKTMITNPSGTKQSVPLKFYLPKEAKEKDVMKVDEGVTVKYDTTSESLYIEGSFTLAPKETKIVSVEITDIWKINETEIDSIKNQAEELTKPLSNTSFFAQGVTLKSDINANLENIKRIQSEAVTPEARIQAYRENLIKIDQVKGEVKELQTLVSSLSSTTSLTGFVGGAQTLSLWGIVLVIGISVVLITTYMRVIITRNNRNESGIKRSIVWNRKKNFLEKICDKKWIKVIFLGSIVIIVGFLVFNGILKLTQKTTSKKDEGTAAVLKVEEEKLKQIAQINNKSETRVLGEMTENKEVDVIKDKIIGKVMIILPTDSTASVKLRENPNLEARVLGKIWVKQKADKYEEKNDWTKVGLEVKTDDEEKYVMGWVRNQFLEK